jgi:hypothetical protein
MPASSNEGHVKRDPETGAVAIRTIFPEDSSPQLAGMAWLVATPNVGARHVPSSGVDGWEDLYVPEVPAEPEMPGLPEFES